MKIVVLSQKASLYSTRRIIEAGKARGHQVRAINHMFCKLIIEKDKPQVYYNEEPIDDVDAIIPRIGASVTFYGAAVIRQFEMMGVPTTTSSDALIRTRDKLRSLQVLTRSGLELPKSGFSNYTSNPAQLIKSIGSGPWIIKLLEGTQGLGVVLVESRKAANSVLEAFNKLKARVMVQEFIAESAGMDIRAFVVNGEVVAAMKRQAPEGEFRSNIHRGATGTFVTLDDEYKKAALKAAEVMGLTIAGVDMLISNRGPLILEVNASPGLEGIETYTKIDVAGKIIESLDSLS